MANATGNKVSKFFGSLISSTKKPKKKRQSEDEDVMTISGPMNVKHEWHVGFDSSTGDFKGLPPSWAQWLQNSNISKTEQTQNPNAVLNALKVYEKSVKRQDHNKFMGTNSVGEAIDEGDVEDDDSQKSRNSEVESPESPSSELEESEPDDRKKATDDGWNEWTPEDDEHKGKSSNSKKKSPDKSVKDATAKMNNVQIDDKKTDGERKPTMRKKSMKKAKLTDDEIMAALRRIVSAENPQKKYAIQKRVGAGASGTVCEATDNTTGNAVAIKIPRGNKMGNHQRKAQYHR